MSDTPLDPYLTKTEYYEKFKRHNRTLTGDINDAFKHNKRDILRLCQLRTKDDEVYEAVDIDSDFWKKLDTEGKAPFWVLHPDLNQILSKGKRTPKKQDRSDSSTSPASEPSDEESTVESRSTSDESESDVSTLALPSDPTVKAVVLEHLHHNNQRHDKAHKKLTDRVLGLVETNQELQRQTNSLMNTLQELIKDRGLGSGVSVSSPTRQEQSLKPATKPIDVVETVATTEAEEVAVVNQPKQAKTSKPQRNKPAVSKKSKAKKNPNSKKRTPSKKSKTHKQSKSIWSRDITSFFTRS